MGDISIKVGGNDGLEFANNFSKAVKDILDTTLNLDLTSEDANEASEKEYPSFTTGLMVLQGTTNVVLSLTFSKMAAAKIVVSLLGMKYNELEDVQVYDAVMEMTNMVAGRLKVAIVGIGERCQLTTPFVFVGANHFFEKTTRPTGKVKKFKDKHFEMLAGVYFL